jgi:hypothetical protein
MVWLSTTPFYRFSMLGDVGGREFDGSWESFAPFDDTLQRLVANARAIL